MAVGITFGGFSLQGANGITTEKISAAMPDRDVSVLKLARADGAKFTGAFFDSKLIEVEGHITGSSVSNYETLEDAFLQNLAAQEANLDIDRAGGTRRYVVTARPPIITRDRSGGFAAFNVQFVCSAGFGVDTSSTTLLGATVLTTTGVNTAITVGGTAPEQRPVITLVLNSGTGTGGTKTVTISNPVTGVGISVTRALWSAADTLVIDCAALTVKVNGAAVDYAGAFPVWGIGSGNIRYADGFTTRNVTLSATYLKRYL